jgi:hypothetical protein
MGEIDSDHLGPAIQLLQTRQRVSCATAKIDHALRIDLYRSEAFEQFVSGLALQIRRIVVRGGGALEGAPHRPGIERFSVRLGQGLTP